MTLGKFETIKSPSKSKSFTCIGNLCDTWLKTVRKRHFSSSSSFLQIEQFHSTLSQLMDRQFRPRLATIFLSLQNEMAFSHEFTFSYVHVSIAIRGVTASQSDMGLGSGVASYFIISFLFGDRFRDAISITASKTSTKHRCEKNRSKNKTMHIKRNGTINMKTENGKQSINSVFRSARKYKETVTRSLFRFRRKFIAIFACRSTKIYDIFQSRRRRCVWVTCVLVVCVSGILVLVVVERKDEMKWAKNLPFCLSWAAVPQKSQINLTIKIVISRTLDPTKANIEHTWAFWCVAWRRRQ